MPRSKAPRLGRPPASNAAETRQRIITTAAEMFAINGYGRTTNKDVALRAGITTGALYYYFDSKLAMYLTVYWELAALVNERLNSAMHEESTFSGKFRAVMEAVYQMNREDPSIARFLGTARVDRMRHEELRSAIPHSPGEGANLVAPMVDAGIEFGEIDPERRDVIEAVMRTIFVGLTDVSAQMADPQYHRRAIDGLEALFAGDLVRHPRRAAPRRAG
ncbi:TetR/AcrR family transcriptional regulator [Frankia sp. Cas3]|uniref:TetR/AcrR family transcriptional regulator n=1 Tax=Frankia sp. Cas3 TaxID=3073926 RepID=UPI002AD3A013|nr:TetR/AcrR family transcriptional regulator [Frankia sp. Cas3]